MRRSAFVIGATSATLVALELAWTRLLSAEFFFTFAFLILSLAILGLGLGALAAHGLARHERDHHVGLALLLASATAMAGPPALFALGLEMAAVLTEPSMLLRFATAIVLLGAPFFFGGIAIALLLRRGVERISRLYASDLLGAALGAILILPLMNTIGTPPATFACVGPILLASWLVSRSPGRFAAILLAGGVVALSGQAGNLLEREREERAPVIYKHWDAMAKVKIFDFDPDYRGLEVDNVANSPLYRFDGNWDRPDSLRFEFGIDVSFLVDRFDSCTFLSLGSGGGTDVLQALQGGCTEVHAVEVVPHVNRLMLEGDVSEFTGRIYHDPRVHVATEDGRAYVRRFSDKFDIIYSLSSNTFAALASGAFAMAENYLFTTDAFADYWNALTDDGFLMMEHQFYVPRLVSEMRDALIGLGVESPEEHFAVYALPEMRRQMILMSRRTLTDEIRNRAFGELTPENDGQIHLLWPPNEDHADNPIERIVRRGWREEAEAASIDLSPCTDDRPYTAQLGRWRNLTREKLSDPISPLAEIRGFPLAKMLVVVTILVVLLLVLPIHALAFLGSGPRLRAVPWLFFAVIGVAFMMIEVVLIQKYTFLIGPSPYGLATILTALLVGAGLGSRVSPRVNGRIAFAGIIGWLVIDALLFDRLIHALSGLDLAVRLGLTAALITPLGVFLGMPFPKAAGRVGPLVAWAFAVNGTASVVGSAGVLLVTFSQGFRVALLLAAFFYAVAFALFSWKRAWGGPVAEPPAA